MPIARVSIFPLSGALLLPGMELPLHIFEPRYRALIHDAMARDRRIGMIQPRGDGSVKEAHAAAQPPLFDVGCLGHVSQIEALEDGRFNIILTGLARFRVVRELPVATQFRQVEADIEQAPQEDEILSAVERAALVNGIAQIAPFDPAAKQTLLEADTLSERSERIIQLMQIVGRIERDGGATMQ